MLLSYKGEKKRDIQIGKTQPVALALAAEKEACN